MLYELNQAKKEVFLISNWHLAFLNLIMNATIGENWSAFFDIIIVKADKPLF